MEALIGRPLATEAAKTFDTPKSKPKIVTSRAASAPYGVGVVAHKTERREVCDAIRLVLCSGWRTPTRVEGVAAEAIFRAALDLRSSPRGQRQQRSRRGRERER